MKKIINYILILFLIILPTKVYAFSFNCENNKHYVNDTFLCTLTTDATETYYDILKGTLTIPSELSCDINSISSGLDYVSYGENRFDLKGQPLENYIVKYNCRVVKDVSFITTKQIIISDFGYHILYGTTDVDTEVLRSSEILLYPLSEKTKPITDLKPRDTSNPNSLLKNLTITEIPFTFSKYQTMYTDLNVTWETEKINIIPDVNIEGAHYYIEGNTALQVGENTIDIKVVSPDQLSTTYYTLNINRLAKGEEMYYPKKDAALKTLEIEGFNIKFDKDKYEYQVKIPYEQQNLIINASPSYDEATITKNFPEKLINGSIITIKVKSEDGTNENSYKIKIIKETPKKDYSLYIIIGAFIVFIIILIFAVIKSNKKKQNKDPLLKLKNNKRTLNKGNIFNTSIVPDSGTQELVEDIDTLDDMNIQPSVINGAVVNQAAMPIQTNQVVDTNLNKVSSSVNTLDLSVSDKAQPINIPNSNNNQNQP